MTPEFIEYHQKLYYKTPMGELLSVRIALYKTTYFYLKVYTTDELQNPPFRLSEVTINLQKCLSIESARQGMENYAKTLISQGYTYSQKGEEELTSEYPQPMLAHRWEKHSHKMPFPCFIQPKLDGVRCLIENRGEDQILCWSRNGNLFYTTKHIESSLRGILPRGVILDGELYTHGKKFNEIYSLVSNISNYTEDSNLEYHIYDLADSELSQFDRWKKLYEIGKQLSSNSSIRFTLTEVVNSPTEAINLASSFVSKGYEGAIVRNPNSLYSFAKRTSSLLKIKAFLEEDFIIVDGIEGVGKDEEAVIWVCKTPKGDTFNVRPAETYAKRQEQFQNKEKYIGKKLTVKYFEKSENGIPRFPVGIRIKGELE